MKLRGIRLANVRRFIEPVEVAGLGDGLNLLSAPNEAGKSTVFDALNALFFARAKSWDRAVRSLQPHAGGDPQVSVEIETGAGAYTLSKTWSSAPGRKDVRVTQAGRVVAQADAAEAWIADLVTPPKEGGPAGLLWVRQGLVSLEDDEGGLAARRDLLSSVTGEVEALTGGRRMDAALAGIRADLGIYLTPSGAKPRTGGPLDIAEAELTGLQGARDDLASRAQALRGDLDRRRELRRELAGLENPRALRDRQDKLRAAEATLAEAERHAEKLRHAMAEAGKAQAVLQATRQRAELLSAALDARAAAGAALAEAQAGLRAAREVLAAREAGLEELETAEREAVAAADAAGLMLRRVQGAAAGLAAQALRQELTDRIDRGARQEQRIAEAEAAAAQGPDADTMAELDSLAEAARMAAHLRDAAAPTVEIRYDDGAAGSVLLDGAALPDGVPRPVLARATLRLVGLGDLVVSPGAGPAASDLPRRQTELRAALTAAGSDTLEAARDAARARQSARDAHTALARSFAAEFPDGLAPLRARLAGLPAPPEDTGTLPAPAEAETAFAIADGARLAAFGRAEAARQAAAAARALVEKCDWQRAAAEAAATQAAAALAVHDDPDAALADERRRLAEQQEAAEAAEAARAGLASGAPDPEAARVRVARLTAAEAQASARRGAVRIEIATLDGRISQVADAGIDEDLAETEDRLAAATARRDALRFEVAVLKRLQTALETARAASLDTFVAPVIAELRPLLAQVLPGADLALDAEAVLPLELSRDGLAEPVDVLSGGTREQIALLVRLAFARMLARAGRPAPVILDDAIVFTDDDRIERMFDALTQQAQDLQILVFSCRQKAFRDLGGRQVSIAASGGAAAAPAASAPVQATGR